MWKSLCLPLLLAACQSAPGGAVQLGSQRPKGDCQEIGQVIGNAHSSEDSREKTMADLR